MRRKKIYYLPGFISLIGLPLLLFFMGPKDPVQQNTIRLFLPYDQDPPDHRYKVFSKQNILNGFKKKKMLTVKLWGYRGGERDDKEIYRLHAKFNLVIQEMERLQLINDTSTVLKLELGEDNIYADFVWIINQCIIDDYRRYMFADTSFYLLANPPVPRPQTGYIDQEPFYFPAVKEPSKWEAFKSDIQFQLMLMRYKLNMMYRMLQQNSLLVIGFGFFIFLPGLIAIFKKRNTGLYKRAVSW